MEEKHAELQDIVIQWLHSRHCDTFAKQVPWNGETVDAIGLNYINYRKVASITYAFYSLIASVARNEQMRPVLLANRFSRALTAESILTAIGVERMARASRH